MIQPRARRLPLMAAGMVSLLAGLWAGVLRLGWNAPAPEAGFAMLHGPLMIGAFLGTLIGLERAVALGRGWAFAAPLCTALGAVALLAGAPGLLAPALMTAGSLVLLGVFMVLVRAEPTAHTATMGVGALAWAVGNGRWLAGAEIPELVSLWIGFLVLTIAGERLELSRMLPVTRGNRVSFAAVLALLFVGVGLGGVASDVGARTLGMALIFLMLWLLRHDVVRWTVRQQGLPRFTAVCLLSGYAWLGIGGLCALWCGQVVAGPQYDAVLHAVFVGFVVAMIFGHAPIIFPAVLGMAVPFRPAFYAHLALLQISLVVRLFGDLLPFVAARQWGGALNAVAVVLFLLNTVRAVWLGRRPARAPAGSAPSPEREQPVPHGGAQTN